MIDYYSEIFDINYADNFAQEVTDLFFACPNRALARLVYCILAICYLLIQSYWEIKTAAWEGIVYCTKKKKKKKRSNTGIKEIIKL